MSDNNNENEALLLVDDNPTNLQVLYQTLETTGCKLLVAKNGETALAISATSGDGMEQLRDFLKRDVGFAGSSAGDFSARRRHLQAMECARDHVERGVTQLEASQALLGTRQDVAQLCIEQQRRVARRQRARDEGGDLLSRDGRAIVCACNSWHLRPTKAFLRSEERK